MFPLKKWTAILLPVFLLGCPGDQALEARQLFQFFQAGCPTQGQWTRAALAQAESLITVIKSIQNDPDCKTISGALGELELLKSKIAYFRDKNDEREILSLRRQEQELLMQLASSPDVASTDWIRTRLRETQIAIVQSEGFRDANETVSHRSDVARFQDVLLSVRQVLNQAVANQACLLKMPSLLPDVASVVGSVSSAAVTSGSSLILATGVSLLGAVVEAVRKANLNEKINLLSKDLTANAYQCVLESLSNQWCSAQDALNIIDIKIKAISENKKTSVNISSKVPAWKDVLLIDRELKLILSWLEKVRGGTDPSNTAEGERQQKIFTKIAKIQSAKSILYAVLREKEDAFQAQKTAKDQWIIEKNAIMEIIRRVSGYGNFNPNADIPNPMLDIFSGDVAHYYLVGLEGEEIPKQNGNYLSFESVFDPFNSEHWKKPEPFVPSLEGVLTRFLDWYSRSKSIVENERVRILQSDSLQVIFDAITQDSKKRSVEWALGKVMDFLIRNHPRSFSSSVHQKIFDDTLRRLDHILAEILKVVEPGSDYAPLVALNEIYKQAELEFGVGVMQNRIESSIRIALNYLILNEPGEHQDKIAHLRVAEDVLEELKRFSASDDLTSMRKDVENSQIATERTLSGFAEVFGSNIEDSLEDYLKLDWSGADTKYTRAKNTLCLKLLSVRQWPSQISKKLCLGAELPSVFPGGPPSLKITKDTFELPLEKRMCTYRDYLRMSRIYQDFVSEE